MGWIRGAGAWGVAAALGLAIGACGPADLPKPTFSASGRASPSASAEIARGACTLLTAAEVQAVMGAPIHAPGEDGDNNPDSSCSFMAGRVGNVVVHLHRGSSAADAASAYAAQEATIKRERSWDVVAGIGDQATEGISRAGASITVRKRNSVFMIEITDLHHGKVATPPTHAQLQQLARKAVTRL